LPKVIDILKARWAEVLLVVGFQTGVLFLFEQIVMTADEQAASRRAAMPEHIAFLLGVGTMAFAIIAQMLYLGFLRTAYEEGITRWEPGQLLRIGRYYFWRVVRFSLLMAAAIVGLLIPLMSIAYAVTGIKPPEPLPVWATGVVLICILIVLIKPMIFSQAIMIARDVMALRSIGMLSEYRLTQAPGIVAIYILVLALGAGQSMIDKVFELKGTLHYLLMGTHYVVLSVAMLAMHLMALRVIKANEPPVVRPVEDTV
jgi:hypothetical protein